MLYLFIINITANGSLNNSQLHSSKSKTTGNIMLAFVREDVVRQVARGHHILF